MNNFIALIGPVQNSLNAYVNNLLQYFLDPNCWLLELQVLTIYGSLAGFLGNKFSL